MKRRGFTLTELLIVVGIILTLATLTMAIFSTKNSDRTRSAARIAQSAFLGAKDRAMNAKDFRGIRLIRDEQNSALVTGFAFVQPIQHAPYPSGSIQLEWDNGSVVLVHGASTGKTAVDWSFVSSKFATPGQIRIPAGTGQWYQFTIDQTGPAKLASGNEYLRLAVPYSALSPVNNAASGLPAFPSTNKGTNSCDIQFGTELLPFHQPTPMPSGVVIDLRYCSVNVQALAAAGNVDLMFSPRGTISGPMGGSGAVYLTLRDIQDAAQGFDPSNPACTGECLIVAVIPQTGLVQTYAADLTDADNDGKADDLFRFAKSGKAAGR